VSGTRKLSGESECTLEEQIAEGDQGLSRFVWSGTYQGEFISIPATHRPIAVWGMVIDRYAGEKIISTRILMVDRQPVQNITVPTSLS